MSAVRCLTNCTIKHGLPLQPELRACLLATLRDGAIDMTLKLAVVDEVLRLITTQACPEEDVPHFLAALILQYFERPDSEQVIEQSTQRASNRPKYPTQTGGIRKIRHALDLFFCQFVRVSIERCNQVFLGAMMATYSMIKGKVELSGIEGQKLAKWDTVNVYKIIAKFLNLLSYGNVVKNAIVDIRDAKISY